MTRCEIRRRGGRAALGLLLLVGLLVSGVETDHARAAASHRRAERLLALTNEARVEHGRRALALDAGLSRYAKRHSRAMAEAGELFHSEDLAAVLDGREWSVGGENVGVGTSLAGLQRAFLASKPHRRNILRRTYDHAAIGIVRSDGNIWVTVIFYG